ncbi:MAG: SGNH/GDSL hydrolase family protein [Ruminococcaceae bacterium]|nr:SGNH/GDSL hydrolase family protein [Oscillospiraceae bacterium]
MILEKGQTILFQGDSVTDCGRSRENDQDLGRGYAMMIAARLTAERPDLGLHFINRGISGNRSGDLVERWQEDCLDIKPDWVSIMIGINDTWRRYDQNNPTSTETYGENLQCLFQMTSAAGIGLIVIEPFFLPYPEDRRTWHVDLDPKVAALRELAYTYAARYIPLGGLMHAASQLLPYAVWAADGVHPTPAGHALICQAFLDAVSR